MCTLSLSFGDVSGIDHVHHFYLGGGGGFLLPSSVWSPGLLVIIAMQPLVLVPGVYLAGLFEHPAISVSVIGWFIGGAMNLARAIEDAVQTGQSRIVSLERLLPLTGYGVTESGIDCCILRIVAIISALVSVALWLSVTVTNV